MALVYTQASTHRHLRTAMIGEWFRVLHIVSVGIFSRGTLTVVLRHFLLGVLVLQFVVVLYAGMCGEGIH